MTSINLPFSVEEFAFGLSLERGLEGYGMGTSSKGGKSVKFSEENTRRLEIVESVSLLELSSHCDVEVYF